MKTRTLLIVTLFGVFLCGQPARPEDRPEKGRARVLEACEKVFGPAVDPERGFFEVDRDFVLEVKFDGSGRLVQLGVLPKHWFGDTHPEWDETEDVGELTEAQYDALLRRLDGIEPKGSVVQLDESPVVVGTELRRRDEYEHAVVLTGDVVDDTRPEDAPRAVKYLIVYPTSELSAEEANEDWKMIANHDFSFSIPRAFKKTDARCTDSFCEEYKGDGITIMFEYGPFSSSFFGNSGATTYEEVQVDGESTRIGTVEESFGRPGARFSTQVYLKQGAGHSNLSMFASCRTEKELQMAKKIFLTIRFSRAPADRP